MKIINVLMTKTDKGSPDGTVTRTYEKGKEYNLPESLARVFIDQMEVAEEVTETVEDKDTADDGLGDETPEPPKTEKKPTRASRKAAAK